MSLRQPSAIPLPAEAGSAARRCPLCEANCGLDVTIADGEIQSITPRRTAVLSNGFACKKGLSLAEHNADPDRLRRPLIRRDGILVEVGWREAYAEVERLLARVIERHGRTSVAIYRGNPNSSSLDRSTGSNQFARVLGTPQMYSAASVDANSAALAADWVFGVPWAVPVPDVERTSYLIVVGANPVDSNGSLLTAPNMSRRLKAIQQRGGKVVVLDPRRTRTADLADEHYFVTPGTDAVALLAMIHVIVAEDLVDLGAWATRVDGLDEMARAAAQYPPQRASSICGVPEHVLERLAREFASAPSASVYGRTGTCLQAFATLANVCINGLNVITGNVDRPGGAMFPLPAAGGPTVSAPAAGSRGRWATRVRGVSEFAGELPLGCLAEEMDTAGPDRVRALICMAGNPVLSAPNGARLKKAVGDLDCLISIDVYLSETARLADVVLPSPRWGTAGHYPSFATQMACRNYAVYSPPVLPLLPDERSDEETMLRLTLVARGQSIHGDVEPLKNEIVEAMAARASRTLASQGFELSTTDVVDRLAGGSMAAKLLDISLRLGPYGDRFDAASGGLSLQTLVDSPDGIDLGPLEPRLADFIGTPNGHIQLAPALLAGQVAELDSYVAQVPTLRLFGRRGRKSLNSWLHNLPSMGTDRCTAQLHPEEARRWAVEDGQDIVLTGPAGQVRLTAEFTTDVMPGTVCVPHGFGHSEVAGGPRRAAAQDGPSINDITDDRALDISGNAGFNGTPVSIAPARLSPYPPL